MGKPVLGKCVKQGCLAGYLTLKIRRRPRRTDIILKLWLKCGDASCCLPLDKLFHLLWIVFASGTFFLIQLKKAANRDPELFVF